MNLCQTCGKPRNRFLPFHNCAVQAAREHLARQPPVGGQSAVRTLELLNMGETSQWAPAAYGEYYAISPLIYSAVKLRADHVAQPPLVVYKRMANGDMEPVGPTHPYQELLDRVNRFWTRADLMRATSTQLDLWGGSFWWLRREGSKIAEIWVLRPDKMTVSGSETEYIDGYTYTHQSTQRKFAPNEIIWFRHYNPLQELSGLAPLAPLRLSVDMGRDALRHNRNRFKNGILINDVWIELETVPSQAELDDFFLRLKKRYGQPENAWWPMVGYPGMKPHNLGVSPKDMEFEKVMRWALEDVARVYQVPPVLLQDLSRSTFANYDTARRVFWQNIMIYLKFLASEINEMLTPQFGDDLEVDFDLSEIEALQPDKVEQSKRMLAEVSSGVRTINEAREELGLEPVAWGDVAWLPLALQPVKDDSVPGVAGEPPTGTALTPSTEDFQPNGHKKWLSPAMGEANLKAVWGHYDKAFKVGSGRFLELQRRLFEGQRRETVRRLREAWANEGGTRDVSQLVVNQPERQDKQFGGIFNVQGWNQAYARQGRPLLAQLLALGARQAASSFGLGTFDAHDEGVVAWLTGRVGFWASRVNEETAKLLTQEIAEALDKGEGIREIEARVNTVFQVSDAVRAERIARTETQAAVNHGSLEMYLQNDAVENKMWLATLDDRVRDGHLEAHGQVVPKDEPFTVMGEQIMAPGDGSPEVAINCRCSTVPVLGRSYGIRKRTGLLVTDGEHPPIGNTDAEGVKTDGNRKPRRVKKTIKRDTQGFAVEVVEEELIDETNGNRSALEAVPEKGLVN